MKIRWQVIVAVMLLCVLVFFVTTSVFAKLKVEKPLFNVLQNHKDILDFEIEEGKGFTNVIVTLNDTERPIEIHNELTETIGSIVSQQFSISYNYEPPKESSELWDKYWRVTATMEEVITTKNYTYTIETLDELIGPDNYYFLVKNNQILFSFNLGQNKYFNVYSLERGATDGN